MSWLDTLEEIRTRDFGKASPNEREKVAREVVNLCSYACAVVAVAPMPFSDVVLMLPIQSAMVMTVGHVYGRRVSGATSKEIVLELGATVGAGMLARQGLKALLPVVGALLTVPAAFAANWAIGRVAIEYFKHPSSSRERLRAIYGEAKDEAKRFFSRKAFDRFRKEAEATARPKPKRAVRRPRKAQNGVAPGSKAPGDAPRSARSGKPDRPSAGHRSTHLRGNRTSSKRVDSY